MPVSYFVDRSREIVFSRGWGVISDAEILQHAKSLRAEPGFDRGFRQIVDFRAATEVRVTSNGVYELAQNNPFNRDARRAIVAPTDEIASLSRLFGMFTESDQAQFGIFPSYGAALEWIGLDASTPWPNEVSWSLEAP